MLHILLVTFSIGMATLALAAQERQAETLPGWRTIPGVYVVLRTSEGEIVLRMFSEDAPRTVANFVGLAEGTREFIDHRTGEQVRRPFYDGLTFHRVVPGVLVQGGCPFGDGRGGPGYFLEDERPLKRGYFRGALAMARIQGRPGTAGSQFFILLDDLESRLPREYVVFGHVADGLELLDGLAARPLVPNQWDPRERSRPLEPLRIDQVRVVRIPRPGGR